MPPRRVRRAEVVDAVRQLARSRPDQTTFVGVDGPGGAGKSTLAAQLAAAVAHSALVAVDDFSGPRVAEWDWSRLRAQVLLPLLAGQSAHYQRWDWDRDEGAEWHDIAPGRLVVIEGVSSTRAEVGVPWALTIWVQTPRAVRLERAMERDGEAMRAQWLDVWMPSEEAYIAAQRPHERVDLLVSGTEADLQRERKPDSG